MLWFEICYTDRLELVSIISFINSDAHWNVKHASDGVVIGWLALQNGTFLRKLEVFSSPSAGFTGACTSRQRHADNVTRILVYVLVIKRLKFLLLLHLDDIITIKCYFINNSAKTLSYMNTKGNGEVKFACLLFWSVRFTQHITGNATFELVTSSFYRPVFL